MPDHPDALLSQVSAQIATQVGLHFPPERFSDLQRGLANAAAELGFDNLPACLRGLAAAPFARTQIQILASHLTVGETYFFRDRAIFEALETTVLPRLREKRRGERRLRIWSAACCSGEEAYSLAIAVQRTIPDLSGWHVRILGTDINRHFLRKAEEAVYGEWSFRETLPAERERYFTAGGDGRWTVRPAVREMVQFSYLNLAEGPYPSLMTDTNAMDLIFCRNALIYFRPDQAQRVVRNLARSLSDDGWLMLAASEAPQAAAAPELSLVHLSGTIAFQKAAQPSQPPLNPPTAVLPAAPPPAAMPQPPSCMQGRTGRRTTTVISLPPPDSPFEAASSLYREGRYAEAVSMLSTPNAGTEPPILALLSRALANLGKLEAALASCDRLIATDRMNPVGHYLRGDILRELGREDEAAGSFRRALYIDPEFVLAYFVLAHLARQRGQALQARRHLANAMALARALPADQPLPESDGLTAGELTKLIAALQAERAA